MTLVLKRDSVTRKVWHFIILYLGVALGLPTTMVRELVLHFCNPASNSCEFSKWRHCYSICCISCVFLPELASPFLNSSLSVRIKNHLTLTNSTPPSRHLVLWICQYLVLPTERIEKSIKGRRIAHILHFRNEECLSRQEMDTKGGWSKGRVAGPVLPWCTLRPPPFPTPGQAWGTYLVCGCPLC